MELICLFFGKRLDLRVVIVHTVYIQWENVSVKPRNVDKISEKIWFAPSVGTASCNSIIGSVANVAISLTADQLQALQVYQK